jgi:hypothetical protein
VARPAGMVRSSASVREANLTPRCSSSWRIAKRSVTERRQWSKRQTSTRSISRRRAAFSSFSRLPAAPPGVHLAHLHGNRPAAPGRILPHGTILRASVCRSFVETRAYSPARNIFPDLRAWPKTCFARRLDGKNGQWRPLACIFRVGDQTLGAHGVASSSNSARPAHFVGSVLNAVAPRIAQHVIEIRSAHRNFGARQPRSYFGRNPPQLRIEPQAGFPRRRNLCRQKRHSELPPFLTRAARP